MARRGGYGFLAYVAATVSVSGYFGFAAVQGDLGVFKRLQLEAEIARLTNEKARLDRDVSMMENRVRRLSDSFLDLDLLDERARDVLGAMRADERLVR